MRIRKEVIEKIQDSRPVRLKLALALDKSENQCRRYVDNNTDDLTKAAALAVIREATGLTDDQILETNSLAEKV